MLILLPNAAFVLLHITTYYITLSFFILYVNDLVVQENNIFVTKYADDTSFLVKNSNLANLINQTNILLIDINAWFTKNKLKLDASKTNAH